MKVRFSAEARSRLRSIHRYIARDSPAHADAVIQRLMRRAEEITGAPKAGRQVLEYGQANVREILIRPYRIIYRLQSEAIEIITVMHYRQLLPDELLPPPR